MIKENTYNNSFFSDEMSFKNYYVQIQTYIDSIKQYYNTKIEELTFKNNMLESDINSLNKKIKSLENYCQLPWYKKLKSFKNN